MTQPQHAIAVVDARLDEAKVKPLAGPAGDVAARSLPFPDFTYRHYWGSFKGWVQFNLNTSMITHVSNVLASASESHELASTTDPVPHPFMGSARFQVYNVVPYDGGVSVRMYIDWGSPLYTQVSYVVVNP